MRELHAFFTSEGYDTVFVEHLMAALDINSDGFVNREEWRAGCTVLRGSELLMSMTDPVEPPHTTVFLELLSPHFLKPTGEVTIDKRHHTVHLVENVVLGKRAKGCVIPHAEHRAIQLAQLRTLLAHVKRRCDQEVWVHPDGKRMTTAEVNQYDVTAYVTKPVTRERKCSYVEIVANDEQKPDWFVSHAWADSFQQMFACLEQHARDRNFDLSRTVYWVCAYAISPWNLGKPFEGHVENSAFFKAMNISDGTVSVVGKGAHSRAWICFEIYQSLKTDDNRGGYLYDIYTASHHKLRGELVSLPNQPKRFLPGTGYEHEKGVKIEEVVQVREAVGLTDDLCVADSCMWLEHFHKGWHIKGLREAHFPIAPLEPLLELTIEKSDVSVDDDLVHILNAIAGDRAMDAKPALSHPEYDAFNSFVRGRITAQCFERVIDEGGQLLHRMLLVLMSSPLLDFRVDLAHRRRPISTEIFTELIEALPKTLVNLKICTPPQVSTLPDGKLGKLKDLEHLDLSGSVGLVTLPNDLAELRSLQHLDLNGLGLLEALPEKLISSLSKLRTLDLTGCEKIQTIVAHGASRCQLAILTMVDCTSLCELADTLAINLAGLEVLNMDGCVNLPELPRWVAAMEASGVAVTRPEHLR